MEPSHWREIAFEMFPSGIPEPYSEDPTQWLFHGHPAMADRSTALQVAVARLLGYHWPPELEPEMRLSREGREWVARCESLQEHADGDGIVCLSAVHGKPPAEDRLRKLLASAWGSDWSPETERQLLAATPSKKASDSLGIWLRDKFFEEHCLIFDKRPFVWQFWDGQRNGFSALVNAHKLTGSNGEGRRTLEALTYSYLGYWIERLKVDLKAEKEGVETRLLAAQSLQRELKKILIGDPPYDLFVRWKPISNQPLGWEPDINDGVRLNIRPFMKASLEGGKQGTGVLRWMPKIDWKKDVGKEPECLRPREHFPWFWGFPGGDSQAERTDFRGSEVYDGNRWNDLHYSRSFKEAARRRAAGEEEE